MPIVSNIGKNKLDFSQNLVFFVSNSSLVIINPSNAIKIEAWKILFPINYDWTLCQFIFNDYSGII